MPERRVGSVVVITGASSGIGRATALEFAKWGSSIVLAARRQDALDTLAHDCERLGGRALAVATDVTDPEHMEALGAAARQAFGRIDVWVNNAAVTAIGPFEEIPPDVTRRVVETNLMGYLHGARVAIRRFRAQGHGVLINVASAVAKGGERYVAVYAATKSAVVCLSDSLRQEVVEDRDIEILVILPASIDTPIFRHGANYAGRAARPMRPVRPPEMVARDIVRLAHAPRPEMYSGRWGRAIPLLRALSPRLYDRLAARKVERDQFSDRAVVPSPGNLFAPMSQYTDTSGGWSAETTPSRDAGLIVLVSLALLGAATALVLRRGRS